MESILDAIKFMFGQLGVVGGVCFLMSGYLAWLHHVEREDHKQTRKATELDLEKRLEIHKEYISTLVEIKSLLEALDREPH